MQFSWEKGDGYLVVRPHGRLDISKTEDFKAEILAKIDAEPSPLVINMSGVTYLSSSGVGVVLTVRRRLDAHKLPLALCRIPPSVSKVLQLVDVIQLLNLFEEEEEAVDFLTKK